MRRYNLDAPNRLETPCNLQNLDQWIADVVKIIPDKALRAVIHHVCGNLDSFVKWPQKATLLWLGCDRVRESYGKQKYFAYPDKIQRSARVRGVRLDRRANGPAVASFVFAGGERPGRYGSHNSWSIHHLYSGKFPYCGMEETTHAKEDGNHFTQSAGLVAVHPVSDALCDEFPCITWFLRAKSFQKFGYDPDGVFSGVKHDKFGFVRPYSTNVFYR